MNSSIRIDPAVAQRLSADEVHELMFEWGWWAANNQRQPPGRGWTTWLLMGGRGSGKTRAGAEWVRARAANGVGPIAIVGESITEALEVMVLGQSGIMRVTPLEQRPRVRGNMLIWPNGVEGTMLPANDPERFRGPQFAAAWCDEVGKWPNAEAAWDMLQFGLRLGKWPRQVATTTPRATPLMKRLIAEHGTVLTRVTTAENKANLADGLDRDRGERRSDGVRQDRCAYRPGRDLQAQGYRRHYQQRPAATGAAPRP